MSDNCDDIRDALHARGIRGDDAEFLIDNAKFVDKVDRLRTLVGVEPRED